MTFRNLLFILAIACSGHVWAAGEVAPAQTPKADEPQKEVAIKNAWTTETTPDQTRANIQVELTCLNSVGKLMAVESPVAESGELQRMRVSHGRIVTEPVTAVPMRHGKPMAFGPNSVSIMLVDLKKPLPAGTLVPVYLTVVTGGKKVIVEVKAKVRPLESDKPADVAAQSGVAAPPSK